MFPAYGDTSMSPDSGGVELDTLDLSSCADGASGGWASRLDKLLDLDVHGPDGDRASGGVPRAYETTVCVSGVSYAVKNTTLLHSVDTVFRPRELTALMGNSGAGKTTLLELVAGRREEGATCGRVTYNGVALSAGLRHCIAFVHQFDVALPTLTVRETHCSTHGLYCNLL